MRAAPAVSVRCTGGALWRGVQWFLPALAAGVISLWALEHWGPPPFYAGLAAALVGALMWRLTPQQSTLLNWDGQQWWADVEHQVQAGQVQAQVQAQVQVMIDLGPWLLLRWRSGPRRHWFAVSQHEVPGGLHALRAALYSQRLAPQTREPR
jgi:hypothetical protein